MNRMSNARSAPWQNTKRTAINIISIPALPVPHLYVMAHWQRRPYAEGFEILRFIGAFRRLNGQE
jgi:hypothetical protein